MPGRGLTFRFTTGPEWKAVPVALEEEDRLLPRELHSTLREHLQDRVDLAKRKVRSLPVRGSSGKHTGMRQRVAAGTRVAGRGSVLRAVTAMPSGQEIIPRGLDRESGWTHPVFGGPVSVRQRPYRSGWFTETIADGGPDMREAVDDLLENAADRIASAGNTRGIPGV